MKKLGWIVVIVFLLAGCGQAPTPAPATSVPVPPPTAGIANPASQFCRDSGGRSEIRTAADGSQTGYCLFSDGSECEEWAFFRGQCTPGVSLTPVPPVTAIPTAAPTLIPPSTIMTDTLIMAAAATAPEGAYEGVGVRALASLDSRRPLWVAYSFGMRNFNFDPLPSHFVAIYTRSAENWLEIARLELDSADPTMQSIGPDYLAGVTQVAVDPRWVWLQVDGGVGAHGGTYQLLSYDGETLKVQVSWSWDSPGAGSLQDLDGNGWPEVILNATDNYVFCYACSMRRPDFVALYWDQVNQQMVELKIQPLGPDQPQQMRDLVNPAVERAAAGLWKDAAALMEGVTEEMAKYPGTDVWTVRWDEVLIRKHAEELAAAVTDSPFPLLANVFYGDYAAAVDLLRGYKPEEVFTSDPPVFGEATDFITATANYITASASSALSVTPDLAPAYFLRGWALYLAGQGGVAAAADIQKAVDLAPRDELYTQCLTYLRK